MNQDQSVFPTANLLLTHLGGAARAAIAPHLRRVKLELHAAFYEADVPIEQVYFPESVVGSVVDYASSGEPLEIGVFGFDGMSGVPIVLGSDRSLHRSMVQIDGGTALRIRSATLTGLLGDHEEIRIVLLRYAQTFAVQSAQTAASHAHFELPARLARWLLMCHDRVDGDLLELTHEFMAMMLAVRRSGVTVTLHVLEGMGAIRSRRGLVTIIDRERLEEIAGNSYGLPEIEYSRLLSPFGKSLRTRGEPVAA